MAEKEQRSTRHEKMGGHFGNQGCVAANASSPPACQLEVIHAKQWRRALDHRECKSADCRRILTLVQTLSLSDGDAS